eukprot:TRINITY_DN6498_c0_g1_i1.p1 TRINITY_DN6498_c0_g1~~TRINITY_DN6498_c0_g1_i1.p1  ORF type:complete len:435 (-),score=158.49 TRINITY_DN6498_c0_g1_i1:1169-2473(-)
MSSNSSRRGGNSRLEKERDKLIQDRLQVLLSSLLRDDDNKYCVDCDAKGPRWASWNLGLFLCIRCAGIHRNLGVHISKVKSVNLDSWTPVQVASMQAMGNSRARAVYEANLPEDFRRPQGESSLETFIRAKYEKKKYIAKEWVPSKPPDFPEGWTALIEAEKQKKDIKQIRLPSHSIPASTNKTTSATAAAAASNTQPTPRPNNNNTTTTNNTNGHQSSNNADLLALGSTSGTTPAATTNNLVNTGGGATVDLIGIGDPTAPQSNTSTSASNSNAFDAFASSDAASDLKQTEEDFFKSPSVPAQAPNSDKKMSNDSILALFGQSGGGGVNPLPSSFGGNIPQNNFNGLAGFNQNHSNMAHGGSNNGFGLGLAPSSNGGVNPFMSQGDMGTAQVMNQFNGLNLGQGPSPGGPGMLSNPPAKAADSLANLDMWNGF